MDIESTQHEFLTLPEVADLLRVHPLTVRRMLERGEIVGFKIGRTWRFRRTEVDRLAGGGA